MDIGATIKVNMEMQARRNMQIQRRFGGIDFIFILATLHDEPMIFF
jgi:hypothetical protein